MYTVHLAFIASIGSGLLQRKPTHRFAYPSHRSFLKNEQLTRQMGLTIGNFDKRRAAVLASLTSSQCNKFCGSTYANGMDRPRSRPQRL